MSASIWANVSFRVGFLWVNLSILLAILIYHSYRLCYVQRDRKGSSLRILKCISFRHLSFVIIIASILPTLQQALTYTPQYSLADEICRLTVISGIVSSATAKLSLHLFVAMRSQIVHTITNIWYKIGLCMIISDVLFIVYIVSGIPIITASLQYGSFCGATKVSPPVFIWFAANDFVIGFYCLLAFIVPLRKYVWLEQQTDKMSSPQSGDPGLRSVTARVMLYSSIALLSTMLITVVVSQVPRAGGVLFLADNTITALCVTLQFMGTSDRSCLHYIQCMPGSPPESTNTSTKLDMVIHDAPMQSTVVPNQPQLKDNASLSVSLVENDGTQDTDIV